MQLTDCFKEFGLHLYKNIRHLTLIDSRHPSSINARLRDAQLRQLDGCRHDDSTSTEHQSINETARTERRCAGSLTDWTVTLRHATSAV